MEIDIHGAIKVFVEWIGKYECEEYMVLTGYNYL